MKRLLMLMNPYAGTQQGKQFLTDILALFYERGYAPLTFVSHNPGDCTKLAQEYGEQADLVVCAGGDGTLNEVLTGLIESGCQTPVGYIPCGSTNDFASSLHLSRDLLQAARDILDGRVQLLDAGKFGDRYFSYIACFGAFTRASYATPQHMKNMLGHFAYILEGIRDIGDLKPRHIQVVAGEHMVEGDYLFGAVCNSTSVGGLLKLDPNVVDLSDGQFEIILLKQPSNILELNDCLWKLNQQRYDTPMVEFFRTDKVTFYTPDAPDWTLDGEYAPGSEKIEIVNMHHAFRLMVND
ncbi:diacylglycerol kinase family protein [uncultured Ruthenibacterium sp.]|uniref:diacylglycerol/lipid kinase family protein n=1 Tax=uncultured Ruthenibacterium sp. TaxID=1905347 RepID=UPI00349EA78A